MWPFGHTFAMRDQLLIGPGGENKKASSEADRSTGMKRILFAGTLALATFGQALAADLPPAAPPPRAPAAYVPAVAPTYNWGGFYIGVNGGGAFGTTNWTSSTLVGGTTGDFNMNGWLVGGTIGANFQASQLVFGIEGDLDWTNIKGSNSTACGLVSCQTANTYIGTARGRIGFAADRVLIFATGGAAFGNIEMGFTSPSISTTYDTVNKVGWTGGGGVEVAFGDNWTGKIEYLYTSLGSATCTTVLNCGGSGTSVSFNSSLVRAGLNFKFGGGQ
jgi:outer membrane immunogenic protein